MTTQHSFSEFAVPLLDGGFWAALLAYVSTSSSSQTSKTLELQVHGRCSDSHHYSIPQIKEGDIVVYLY